MRDEDLKRQEESQMRIEALRRQTAEYEANIRKETEKARAEAEARGRIEQERKNWDLHMQRSKLESNEFRVTVLEGIREAGSIIGQGFKDYITDTQKLTTTVGVLSAIALGVYTAKMSTSVAGRMIEARLGKPPLVRETSRKTILKTVTTPLQTFKSLFGKRPGAMDGIVMESTLAQRLEALAVSTANTNKNNAPYRHLMLYGPPGTGKTMFAKNLAHSSGMDYAIMTGGDVAPLGRDGVTEMHKLFDWSETSRKGLLLFVDEADAFLRKRTNETLSEDLRNSLNAFLYRTGTESKKFMVVFATNQPDQLDWAINDRTDELIEFDLPAAKERAVMMRQYYNMYVVNSHKTDAGMFGGPTEIKTEEVLDSLFEELARKAEGFSGREISKLAIAWQAAARGTPDCSLTVDMMKQILDERIKQRKQKDAWEADRVF
uniref:AAA+ ATPase domain-containing protein n=1 Tax=Aplanochytrium stocchinoi TaxID=215587 RepID=A0A7S3PKT3_9STRA